MVSAPLPLFIVTSTVSCCFASQTETLVFTGSNISFGTSGSGVFHFLLTSNQPVFVFSSYTCVHTTWSENTLLSRLVNMLFLIYYLLPMGCISECAKQLFRFGVIIMYREITEPDVWPSFYSIYVFLWVYVKFIFPVLFIPPFSQTQQLVNSQSTREKKLLLITFDKWQIVLAWLPANA